VLWHCLPVYAAPAPQAANAGRRQRSKAAQMKHDLRAMMKQLHNMLDTASDTARLVQPTVLSSCTSMLHKPQTHSQDIL